MGTVKKTLFVSSLIGAGLVWLTGSKKGKEVRDQILDQAADVFVEVKKKAQKLDKKYNISKNQFTKLAKDTVDTYFEKSPMASSIKDVVLKTVLSQWDNLKDEAEDRVKETRSAVKKVVKDVKKKSKKT